MNPLILTFALNALLMIAMPLGLAFFLTRRWKIGWRVWWIGCLTFVLSQVGHIPFNAGASLLLGRTGLVNWPAGAQLAFNAVFLGLSAGLFEEGTRYLVLRFGARDVRSWRTGLLYGAGHGGVEAIILGALALANYISWLVLRDPATLASWVASGRIPAEQVTAATEQLAQIWSMPWTLSLLGAVERLFTLPLQICLALLVLQAFTRRQAFWVWLAVLAHALVDALAVLAAPTLSPYVLEGLLGVVALVAVIVIRALYRPEEAPTESRPPQAVQPPATPVSPPQETEENLESTKYQG